MKTASQEKIKIAHIGVYSDPKPTGGNNLLWTQAHELSQLSYDIEIVTCPKKGAWTGAFPIRKHDVFGKVPTLSYRRHGILYNVISPPHKWGIHVSNDEDWKASIQWAKSLLTHIKPSIVHQHHWQKTWYFMEAALQLGVPTIYTAYDWGLPCRRQFLVTGNGKPCNVAPSKLTCSACCSSGKPYDKSQPILADNNSSISLELDRLFDRWEHIANGLSALIVKSPFAKRFYETVGVNSLNIHMMPWFYNQPVGRTTDYPTKPNNLKLGFIGRLVPEKGLHLLLSTLSHLDDLPTLELEIAGLVNSSYAQLLQEQYAQQAGKHKVNWLAWIENGKLGAFFDEIDVLVVPSLWYDNAPTVLAEALAHGCPVICTDIPSMTHLIRHHENGLVFEMNNSTELAACITEFYDDEGFAKHLKEQASYYVDSKYYAAFLSNIYETICFRACHS